MPSLYVVADTPAGYGLFKASDRKLLKRDDLRAKLASVEAVTEALRLKSFEKFSSPTIALEEAAALVNGKVPPTLSELLATIKDPGEATIAIPDPRLSTGIRTLPGFEDTSIYASSSNDPKTEDIYRAIREHLNSLIPESHGTFEKVALGLSHSVHRHKLKFSADKVDVMVIQAVKLIEDMDRELNVYAMRTREWYGWHFPEMSKLISDHVAYSSVILTAGRRDGFPEADLTECLPEEIAEAVKSAAEISMGTDISDEDIENVQLLAAQVVQYSEYRAQISNFLENRMQALAPNLTALVGWLVGAKLIAHTGSLKSLALSPASTIQILGAEKALFRALKTKHNTPKYGIIYNSSLVGQASQKVKGKIARMLAAKTALGLRIDALGPLMNEDNEDETTKAVEQDDEEKSLFGITQRTRLENRLRVLDGKPMLPKGVAVGPDGQIKGGANAFAVSDTRGYNVGADGVANGTPKKPLIEEVLEQNDSEDEDAMDVDEDKKKKEKKKEKKSKSKATAEETAEPDYEKLAESLGLSVKKLKRKIEKGELNADGTPKDGKKKEKKRKRDDDAEEEEAAEADESSSKKKHKKKKSQKA
ncbi:related to nucleolar protein NOP58 [Cephalotrichum gorgonifer]|uniref:Nucleolar protein 58 n=1 Tax=Cephalotrichum gorgonifer TaxID=2041049 RepID=A0AAE8SWJ1_9PEZI|nr:related to nucleolar protein NOP58 [Cephalotrichum gorgonifer]